MTKMTQQNSAADTINALYIVARRESFGPDDRAELLQLIDMVDVELMRMRKYLIACNIPLPA